MKPSFLKYFIEMTLYKYSFIIALPFIIFNFTQAQQEYIEGDRATGGLVIYSARITLHKTELTTDTLQFNRQESIFKWQSQPLEKEKTQATDEGIETQSNISPHDDIGEYNRYDRTVDSVYSRKFLIDQVYFVKEKKPEIKWKIIDNTKKIGDYICTEAIAHFRGRDYTAWFTPQIPVPYGPWKLTGLPGLILQAYDSNKEIYFEIQKLVFSNENSIPNIPVNGREKILTLSQYKEVMANLKKELAQKAQKIARKYRQKYPDADIQIKKTEPKLMEIFDKNEQ